jgi:hypothetical protein
MGMMVRRAVMVLGQAAPLRLPTPRRWQRRRQQGPWKQTRMWVMEAGRSRCGLPRQRPARLRACAVGTSRSSPRSPPG